MLSVRLETHQENLRNCVFYALIPQVSVILILQARQIGQRAEESFEVHPCIPLSWALLVCRVYCSGWSFSTGSKSVAWLGIEARPLFQLPDPQEYF